MDFAQVFEAAGVDAGERDQVAKAQELLRSLPAETPAPVKRQIVEAALKAFGVPTAAIIEAAVEEIRALEAHLQARQGSRKRNEPSKRVTGASPSSKPNRRECARRWSRPAPSRKPACER